MPGMRMLPDECNLIFGCGWIGSDSCAVNGAYKSVPATRFHRRPGGTRPERIVIMHYSKARHARRDDWHNYLDWGPRLVAHRNGAFIDFERSYGDRAISRAMLVYPYARHAVPSVSLWKS